MQLRLRTVDGNVDVDADADVDGVDLYVANCMCEIHAYDVRIFGVANCLSRSIDQS